MCFLSTILMELRLPLWRIAFKERTTLANAATVSMPEVFFKNVALLSKTGNFPTLAMDGKPGASNHRYLWAEPSMLAITRRNKVSLMQVNCENQESGSVVSLRFYFKLGGTYNRNTCYLTLYFCTNVRT